MVGRRLPVVNGQPTWPERPGDYCGSVMGYTGNAPAVFFLKPNARDPGAPAIARSIHHVCSPPHAFRECPDGSLEIRASLGDHHRLEDGSVVSDGWHGYLDEGHVWRQV
jgi:hypothetical protein